MSFDDVESIEIYKDYTYIMYILCDKTSAFYSKIKNIISIPIVICSTGLSILNTTNFNEEIIRYISIGFNLLIALSVAILNLYKIPEKEFSFKSNAMSFLKLHNHINGELAKSKTLLTTIDVVSIINEYNMLCEYIVFHIPSRIRKDITINYQNYKLPLLVTNNNKMISKKKFLFGYYFKQKSPINSNDTTSEKINIYITPDINNINNNTVSPIRSVLSEFSNSSPLPRINDNNYIIKNKPLNIKYSYNNSTKQLEYFK